MKSIRLIPALSALLLAPQLHAEISPVQLLSLENGPTENLGKFDKTQRKTIRIALSNHSQAPIPGLRVRYYFFGKEANNNETLVLEKGELTADLTGHGTATVVSPEFKAAFTEAHYAIKNKKNGTATLGKKTEESGQKITGYGVQVFDKDTIAAEYFSTASLKNDIKNIAIVKKPKRRTR